MAGRCRSLLQEIFAGYYGQRLSAATPYRQLCLPGWPIETLDAAHVGLERGVGRFDNPHWSAASASWGLGGPRHYILPADRGDHGGPRLSFARSCLHNTINTVLQAAWAQIADVADRLSKTSHFGYLRVIRPAGRSW